MARKPSLNMGCEASKEVTADAQGNPLIIMCRKPGQIRDDVKVLKFSTVLCDDCYAYWKEQNA